MSKQFMRDTTELLGHYILTMPPAEQEIFDPEINEIRKMDLSPIMAEHSDNPCDPYRVLSIARIMKRAGHGFDGLQHFYVTCAGEVVGYAIDLNILRRIPNHIIAKNLAEAILSKLEARP